MKVENVKKTSKRKTGIWYVLGSITLAGVMFCIMPKLIKAGSDYFYKKSSPSHRDNGDDWGPEIVKKSTLED